MPAVFKYAVSAIALLSWFAAPAAHAQTPSAGVPDDARARYEEDQKCLAVYTFMAVSERAVPPASLSLYIGLTKTDGAAAGRTDDQVKTDSQTAIMAYMDAIKAQSKDNTVPSNAGWRDDKACNTYFAGRGIIAAPPLAPQPRTGRGGAASQP